MDGKAEKRNVNKKAIALFSGGLDSILAAKVIMDQGIEVLGINFVMEFASINIENHKRRIAEVASQINMKYQFLDISEEYLGVLKNPEHGFGSNINPCIDCKIFMLKKAKDLMKETGASFIITGEVLGERPMSQRRDALNIIEKKSGLKEYLLRPLSAKLLGETIPEKNGIVDRKKLFDIRGRSRKPQFKLAESFGIKKYFNPAGGCLLTDPNFSKRLKDLIGHNAVTLEEIRLLKIGRHFRFSDTTKFILGRDEEDNNKIVNLKNQGDIAFEPDDYSGPMGILRGEDKERFIDLAASFLVSYSKNKHGKKISVIYWTDPAQKKQVFADPVEKELAEGKKVESILN